MKKHYFGLHQIDSLIKKDIFMINTNWHKGYPAHKTTVGIKKFLGRFQAIKTDVLLIFSFITGDKTEFLSPMMFSNEYIIGI